MNDVNKIIDEIVLISDEEKECATSISSIQREIEKIEKRRTDIKESHKFPFGLVDFRFNVKGGKIVEARIFGDFFGLGDIQDVEQQLIGVKYDRASMSEVLKNIDVNKYFGNVTADDLVGMLFD